MKKKVGFIILLIVLGLTTMVISKSVQRINEKQKAKKNYQKMPLLSFYFLQKRKVTRNTPAIINYFSPDCEHCQYMAKQIRKEGYKLDSINYIMIATSSEKDVRVFIKDYQLDSLAFLSVAIDTAGYFSKTFNSKIIPSFYIYNDKQTLVKTVQGETLIDNLLQPLQTDNK